MHNVIFVIVGSVNRHEMHIEQTINILLVNITHIEYMKHEFNVRNKQNFVAIYVYNHKYVRIIIMRIRECSFFSFIFGKS